MGSNWPSIDAGDHVSLRVPNIRDAAGDPVDLSSMTAMVFEVRRTPRDPFNPTEETDNPVVLSRTLAGGAISWEGTDNEHALIGLVAANTRDLGEWYHADFWITDGIGIPYLVKSGAWQIRRVAHRP